MQMQKKITVKDDGRFLAYYHFPATATPEETEVFEGIVPLDPEEEKRRRGEEETQQNAGAVENQQAKFAAKIENAGGESHV